MSTGFRRLRRIDSRPKTSSQDIQPAGGMAMASGSTGRLLPEGIAAKPENSWWENQHS